MDQDLNSIIDLLQRHREIENDKYLNQENAIKTEATTQLTKLKSLRDKHIQIKENINKNLKSLVIQKHGIQKVIQGSECDVPKLPVTHKHQQDTINFVTETINFINKFPEIHNSVEPENDIDIDKLCREINTCGESVNQELNRSKTRVDQVGTFRENTEIIKTHCILPCDDPGLIE